MLRTFDGTMMRSRTGRKSSGSGGHIVWKIAIIAVPVLIVGIVFGRMLFISIMEQQWETQRQAIQRAYEHTGLVKVSEVDRFNGERSYTVIHGEDKLGQKLIVWASGEEIVTRMASDGITEEEAVARLLESVPHAKVVRVQAGMMNGQAIWEVFYKAESEETGKQQYFYDYYTFAEGVKIDTWRLSAR